MSLTPRQSLLLVCLTLAWGFNWPVMKLGVTGFPPLSFRVLSMALGLPVLYAVTRWIGVDLRIPRRDWPELAKLTLTNMLIWHIVSILAVQALSSGRAAILGYTMPVFTALWGRALFGERLAPRQLAGIAAAAVGVGLLLWHELAQIAGRAGGALLMLSGAAVWGLGTQQMRRTTIAAPTLALSWWMSVITLGAVSVLAVILESDQWHLPPTGTWFAVGYNALLIFGFSQPAWLVLARTLPPAASSLSVMMIPVLGALSGAWWLGEALHWQDGAAIVLMGGAIASVLWPVGRVRSGR